MRAPLICFVVTAEGTALKFLEGYLAFLSERGWQVVLVCSPGEGLEAFSRREQIVVRPVPMRRDPSPYHDLISLFRLTTLLRRLRPDIVVYATPKASLLGSVAAALAGVPARVYELWGLRLETTAGATHRVLRQLEKLTIRLSTSVVANSRSLASRVRELGLAGPRVVNVLGAGSSHGVDAERYSQNARTAELDSETQTFLASTAGLTIGYVGRLHPDKGVETLLDAIDLCLGEGIAVRALLVGADEGADFAARVAHQSMAHRVGSVDDTRPYVKEMDLLVLVSLREGFPNVVLEAAAMGIPAIVADSTGTVDSVVPGVTGMVVKTGDVRQLARAIGQLSADQERRTQMGQAAREWVMAEFSQQHVWELHADHFADELERRTSQVALIEQVRRGDA